MSNFLLLVIFGACSYGVGNISWARLISKSKKADITKMGSGNPGTLNMSRNFGLKLGLLTFFLDIFKGAIPTLISYYFFQGRVFYQTTFPVNEFASYACGFLVVLGHVFPVVYKFRGGKGIASTIGVFLVIESVHGWEWAVIAIMALVAAVLFIYFTEFGAMGSFIAISPSAVAGAIRLFLNYGTQKPISGLGYYIATNMLLFAISFLTWFAHRKNIERMLAGDEHPTSIKTMVVKRKIKRQEERESVNLNKDENNV